MQNHFVYVGSALVFRPYGLSVRHDADDGITDGSHHEHERVAYDIEEQPVVEFKVTGQIGFACTGGRLHGRMVDYGLRELSNLKESPSQRFFSVSFPALSLKTLWDLDRSASWLELSCDNLLIVFLQQTDTCQIGLEIESSR